MSENEMKQQARDKKGVLLDSLNITSGSAAKGNAVALKTYYDAHDVEDAQIKIENTLKIRQYLMDKGLIL